LRGGDGDDDLSGDHDLDRCNGGAHVLGDNAESSCELIVAVP
jgi:hypothetical protein